MTVDEIRIAAQDEYGCDEIEINDDAAVSWSEHGAWVAAWVFVRTEGETLATPSGGATS